jgi:kynurenine formamidase
VVSQSTRPSEAEWLDYFQALSNWGRWGDDDTRGTLNLITQECVRKAASLVREGITVSCAREVDFTASPKEDPRRALHFMSHTGSNAAAHGGGGAIDWAILPLHGLTITHLDAHAHMFWDAKMYNGQDARMVTAEQGARRGSLAPAAGGIVGRGVLLDIAALHGVPWLGEGHEISAAELDDAARRQDVQLEPGDILMVRTGYGARRRTDPVTGDGGGPGDERPELPGLGAGSLPWMRAHDVAVAGTDTGTEARPSHYSWLAPFHAVAMVAMGMWIVDNYDLEDLAQTCERLGRYEFMATIATIRLKNSTGSPVNPLAVF